MAVRSRTLALALVAVAVPASAQVSSVAAPSATHSALGAAVRTMNAIGRIQSNLRSARYEHVIAVDERVGRYVFDCSGLTAWVLARTAPDAHRAVMTRVGGGRPLARDYFHTIAGVDPGRTARGWSRVSRVADAQPGDVIAWLRPPIVQSNNTGHVAVIVAAPTPMADGRSYLVRIADSSRYTHQDDTREGSGRTGFGFGTILVVADPSTGAPAAYGWFGQQSQWVLSARMAIGRPVR